MAPRFRVYIAASADGYIADPGGSVAWLDAYPGVEYGYDDFIRSVGTVVMGRASYDLARSFGDWPYPDQRCIVLTRRLPEPPPAGAHVAFRSGDVGALAAELRAMEPAAAPGGDVWVMGGGRVIRQFLDAGALDTLEIYVIPLLLGGGIPLFPPGPGHGLTLRGAQGFASGVVRLEYGARPPAPGGRQADGPGTDR